MTHPAEADTSGLDVRYAPVVRLWALRALMRTNAVSGFVGEHRFQDVAVARLLGWTDSAPPGYSEVWALKELQDRLSALELEAPELPADAVLAENITGLAARIGLTDIERDLLHLCAVQRHHDQFTAVLEMVGPLTRGSVCRVLAECLDRPVQAVQAALAPRGNLCRAALLSLDDGDRYSFPMKVDMLYGLAEGLVQEHEDLLDLFNRVVVGSPPPRLGLGSFPHLAEDIAILRGLLSGAMRAHTQGVNVLVHGRPGTGKTEFVRALVAACGVRLLEIPCGELGRGPRDGGKRFKSFRFAQSLLGSVGGDVLLFDEVEDVFCQASGDIGSDGNASGIKGWVNLALERNPVPTFWVTNHIGSIDPAHLRRFDFVLHMDIPPASVRRAVIDHHADELSLPEPWRARAARHADMAPAVVERAARVGLLVCSAAPGLVPHQVVGRVMNHALAALGCARLLEDDDALPGVDYRLELLNANCDLGRLREGLRRVGEGRVCMYGPPGTGKTEFGRHVALSLDRPLLVRRASDLLSPYLGVAERNIARMFDEARRQGAVLLVDEADSLLRERRHAQRSWEVTQVNEMLTQMESFRGVFIASTNLMETLDEAVMRRFDIRVRLGYLGPHQARDMFTSLATALGVVPDESSRAALARLAVLTPGDFAAVARGARLDAPESAQALVARLQQACEAKRDRSRRPIGFTA